MYQANSLEQRAMNEPEVKEFWVIKDLVKDCIVGVFDSWEKASKVVNTISTSSFTCDRYLHDSIYFELVAHVNKMEMKNK